MEHSEICSEIIMSPQMLEAWLLSKPGDTQSVLKVQVCAVVRPGSKLYKRVLDYLADKCCTELLWETVVSEYWVGRSCTEIEYVIYNECPGPTLGHDCKHPVSS